MINITTPKHRAEIDSGPENGGTVGELVEFLLTLSQTAKIYWDPYFANQKLLIVQPQGFNEVAICESRCD